MKTGNALSRSRWLDRRSRLNDFFGIVSGKDVLSLSSSVAYYTVLSLTPFLLLTFAFVGWIGWSDFPSFQQNVVEALGPSAVIVLQAVQDRLQGDGGGLAFGLFGLLTLIFSATGIISELQNALNAILFDAGERTESKASASTPWSVWLETKALAVLALLFCIFIATVSFVISVLLRFFLPLEDEVFWNVVKQLFSFIVFSVVFCFMFRYLPRLKQPWMFSWKSGLLCSALFHIGKSALEIYFSYSAIRTSYGALSSFIVLLLWAYYNGLIILLSACFARAFFRKEVS